MRHFDSSAIGWAEYDHGAKILTLSFRDNGTVYEYEGVPPWVYDKLCDAESKGRYFAQRIRDLYDYREIEPSSDH